MVKMTLISIKRPNTMLTEKIQIRILEKAIRDTEMQKPVLLVYKRQQYLSYVDNISLINTDKESDGNVT